MRKQLTYLIIHCTATPEGRAVSSNDIERMHKSPKPKGRGWSRLGYSDMIHLNGSLENLTPYDGDEWVDNDEMTWGVAGSNAVSRHIVYVGGMNKAYTHSKDTRTDMQKLALENYIKQTLITCPHVKVAGHNQFSSKACPSFDVPEFCKSINIPLKNIYKP